LSKQKQQLKRIHEEVLDRLSHSDSKCQDLKKAFAELAQKYKATQLENIQLKQELMESQIKIKRLEEDIFKVDLPSIPDERTPRKTVCNVV
jgi:regulator of replication initiation timing